MAAPETDDQIYERAISYPFDVPGASYIYVNGEVRPLDSFDPNDYPGHVAVLAYGSNAAPTQLRRKFGDVDGDITIPVMRVRLHDFDVVYAALIASYGSIPATLQYSPGACLSTFITYLPQCVIPRMHETESVGTSYSYVHLHGIHAEMELGPVVEECEAYLSLSGCLAVDGSCLALAEMAAQDRTFPEATQREALEHVARMTSRNADIRSFVVSSVRDARARQECRDVLASHAVAFDYDHSTINGNV